MRWIGLLVLLCVLSSVADAQYVSKRAFRIYRGDGTEVNGDSGSVVGVYPCDNGALADSAGRRVDLTWYTGPNRWEAVVDTTNDYSFFYRTACCSETLSVALQCVRLHGPIIPASMVSVGALATGAALQNLIDTGGSDAASLRGSSIGSDSLTVEADTIEANYVHASGALSVQSGLLYVDDAAFTLQGIEATFEEDLILEKDVWVLGKVHVDSLASRGGYVFGDSLYIVEYLRVDGPAWLRGDNTMGTGISNTLTVNGTVAASNDITASDDATITDLLTVNGNATLGNADGDLTTLRDLTVANEAQFDGAITSNLGATIGNDNSDLTTVYDLTANDLATLNGNIVAGNATSDTYVSTSDFTHEGDFDIEDSLAVATDFGAADSTKSAVRVNRWFIEMNSDAIKTFTVSGGSTTGTFSWPGARTNDCPFCTPTEASTASGLSSNYTIYIPSTGKATITRSGLTNNLVLRCILFKM